MPNWDALRTERLAVTGERFRTPEGFRVEEVASNDLVGSIVNFTFDHKGRPLVALEGRGLHILEHADGDEERDGTFDTKKRIAESIETAHGIYVLDGHSLLVHANGPEEGTGLYRINGWDDRANGAVQESTIELLMRSTGRIQEHGPHTITRGPDRDLYLLYGNHAAPDIEPAPGSPLRTLQEDQLLPVILDPRGHANSIVAPGGTIWRLDPATNEWQRIVGGLRNPFEMTFSPDGGLFVYEADMEWDRGLPWYRPTRVLHAIPSGDYGWRTGSGKIAFDAIDTLPSAADIGRGSPVGMVFYRHTVYPERYRGALFLGDWARGRIRVLFPERAGATWTGEAHDFLLGEPLNVTDLDVGPDGHLYFSTGGRDTTGGLYRVVYEGEPPAFVDRREHPWERAASQPMPRSAYSRQQVALARASAASHDEFDQGLLGVAADRGRASPERQNALELLQLYSALTLERLRPFLDDVEVGVRATAVSLLEVHGEDAAPVIEKALLDSDALVRRRACDALLRSGIALDAESTLLQALVNLLDDQDRWVRYAAREVLVKLDSEHWPALASFASPSWGEVEALVATVLSPSFATEGRAGGQPLELSAESPSGQQDSTPADRVFGALGAVDLSVLDGELQGAYLRALELALIRDPEASGRQLPSLSSDLLDLYPTGRRPSDRKLERLLAFLHPEGASMALLDELERLDDPAEEIHVVYSLRALESGWSADGRARLVAWFERGRTIRGAASMSGYVDALWRDALDLLPDDERLVAEENRQASDRRKAEQRAQLLTAPPEPDSGPDMSQMSFEELAEFLEYDVMAYERYDPEDGELVFQRARCADCHVFGSIGRGGGPDLSTVVSRFRRREILESIMFPSRVISDQYTALEVETTAGTVIVGLLADDGAEQLTLITASGEREVIPASAIVRREPSNVSLMPEGLLDAISFGDLMSLVRFLEEGD